MKLLNEVDGPVRRDHGEAERKRRKHGPPSAVIATAESQNEGDQVDCQRGDPDQRHRRDVLGDEGGDGNQRERAQRRKRDPEQAQPHVGRLAQGHVAPARAIARRSARGQRANHGDISASASKKDKACGPKPGLFRNVQKRFDEKWIGEEAAQRRRVGNGEQRVGRCRGARVPGLQEGARG